MSTADDSNEPSSSMDTPSEAAAPTRAMAESNTAGSTTDDANDDNDKYKYLVLDAGPIIRLTGLSSLRNRAQSYMTVPAVLDEIRDAHARQHLRSLPFELETREPTPRGMQAMVDFCKQTGDYPSLSSVDLQVLGLLYDLEREANDGNMDHVRTQPKKALGVGRIESLSSSNHYPSKKVVVGTVKEDESNPQESSEDGAARSSVNNSAFFHQAPLIPLAVPDTTTEPEGSTTSAEQHQQQSTSPEKTTPKTWAMMVDPTATASKEAPPAETTKGPKVAHKALNKAFGSMKLSAASSTGSNSPVKQQNQEDHHVVVEGQFSDAEEDSIASSNDDDDNGYANGDKEVSDEECDVYILDPEELEPQAMGQMTDTSIEEELASDFPSLAAAMHVPYEASDEDDDADESELEQKKKTSAVLAKEEAEKQKARALEPRSKSGKYYNSFRNYRDIVKPKRHLSRKNSGGEEDAYYTSGVETVTPDVTTDDDERPPNTRTTTSRIMGGMSFAGQTTQVQDDGEGWITSTGDIRKLKSDGVLDPSAAFRHGNNSHVPKLPEGPPMCNRAACATTDFAMQNVILQMNLELLSVDGIKVRKLKSWVTRCGACFTVYADGSDHGGPQNMKRLFCARCGSDMMQRIAASVDGKTGRLRLHLSKKYKHNLRGTKYSLPKPGTNNRFQGDLLLREDQLLMGAWNQKVKKRSGGKARSAAQSMFGSDLASNVGCHADVFKRDDIKVGFGRRNPNAAKGRERRGKKKKSSDKACGLRRY